MAGADVNGEFLDTLKEYPAYFKEAGISAEEFVGHYGKMRANKVFSPTRGVDTIKEANTRLREMTTATAEALTVSASHQKKYKSHCKTEVQPRSR